MAGKPVLRFPTAGGEHASFLLEVSSNGSRPLDLKLVGSESTAVFLVKLRHKKIDECKATPGHCSDEEWEQILTSTFVDLEPVPDIEVRADVQPDGASVTLSFRKNIQGITQRLGSIKLDESDKTEISPFDWCVSAIASRTRVADELAAAKAQIKSLEQSVEELKSQLDEFIAAKEEDETQLLEKFKDLLNAKKLKIRQQHRLLARAKVDAAKLADDGDGDEQGGRDEDAHRKAGPSRAGKRKAPVKEEEESDDGFERMDVDEREDDGERDVGADTQSGSGSDVDANEGQQLSTDDDATASDPDTDDEPPTVAEVKRKGAPPRGRITKPKASAGKQKQTAQSSRSTRAATRKQTAAAATAAASDDSEEDGDDGDNQLPPPRILPFAKKKTAPPPKPTSSANDDGDKDDDETQSDEDSEL
ncbi:hypothetical protein F5Y14DRAFT_436200 [Nemania sp. NC0429]|nr:hypothetical protein F5Y14DRAFT_436200 [Nemania sp. NC0429]